MKRTFPQYLYANLEDLSARKVATEDPMGFVRSLTGPAIIDEAQHVPEIFSAVQVVSDEKGTPGQFVLSGSQNFLMQKSISQSLAGRVGQLVLLPLSYQELVADDRDNGVEDYLLRGGYPRLYDSSIPSEIYYGNYLRTYVERDVAGYIDASSIDTFSTFIRLCALQAGKLINYTGLAREVGVSYRTIRSWMSILEASYLIFRLLPYHANTGKTLTKTPKLYFLDSGLLAYFLDVTPANFMMSEHKGALMENIIIAETAKRYLNQITQPRLFFYRDDSKIEADLLDMTGATPQVIEIKASQTYHTKYARHLQTVSDSIRQPDARQIVVYSGDEDYSLNSHEVISARTYLLS